MSPKAIEFRNRIIASKNKIKNPDLADLIIDGLNFAFNELEKRFEETGNKEAIEILREYGS